MTQFADREAAGRALAEALTSYRGRDDAVVVALPRGGVPVAYRIADALGLPLDVLIVRKLGAPGQPELALGAIASGGIRVLNDDLIEALAVSAQTIEAETAREQRELERREQAYRGERPALAGQGRTVILVDDGAATGASLAAALAALRRQRPARIVVALPHASAEACRQLRRAADEVVCLATPEPYVAVGCWYRDFSQTRDREVRELLRRAAE